jgi:hypothetical protein
VAEEKTELEILKEISQKLDDLITIIFIQGKPRDEIIKIMVSRGYSNANISKITGIPKGTVDVVRADFSKKK